MSDPSANIVAKAELFLEKKQFDAAARAFEEAAATALDRAGRATLLKRAAAAYLQVRSTHAAGRCYAQLAPLLEKQDKADTLMIYWRALILAIAGSLWECNFEWKGEPDHHEDHVAHEQEVEEYRREAERVLIEVLRIEGVDRNAILKEAKAECRRRQKDGGWGAVQCRKIIAAASQADALSRVTGWRRQA